MVKGDGGRVTGVPSAKRACKKTESGQNSLLSVAVDDKSALVVE